MKSPQLEDPFRPDFGDTPPHLAGREDEQNVFKSYMDELSVGVSPSAPVVLYGPRGMGKTALLGWFQNEVEKSGAKKDSIRVVKTVPNDIKSRSALWKSMLKPSIWGSHDYSNPRIREVLTKQCKKQPFIYLIDEAQSMDSDVCNLLLNVHQIISSNAPFMLVLTGTPGLGNFLSNTGASFIERAKYISLGRLDEQAAADAINKPLEEQGIQITDDALSLIVEDSQCYPYFLQVWGKSLWMEANKENLTRLTNEQVAVVKPDIDIIKQKMYEGRRHKLNKLGLRSTAIAIAQAFQDTKAMSEDPIMEIITGNLSVDSLNTQSAIERLQTFIDNDFIWKSQESILFEPGIPSFMTHVLNSEKELRLSIESDISKEKDDKTPAHGR